MKFQNRKSINRSARNAVIRRAGQRSLLAVTEVLEVRQLLSAALSSKGVASHPALPQPTVTKPVTFNAGKSKVERTVLAPVKGARGGETPPPVSINVGSVVDISQRVGNETEADIAINPTNTNLIFAQSNLASGTGLFASRSSDGGVNWTKSVIATGSDGLAAACCDGRVAYDKFGNLWMVYLNTSAGALIIARSLDNGATWTQMLSRASSWDNPSIGTGSDGSTWVSARGTGGVIAFGWKATGLGTLDTTIGAGTGFSPNQVISIAGSGNYGDTAVGNDGSVYVTWTSNAGGQGPNNDPIVRDPDGFGPAAFSGVLRNFATNVGGFDFIPAQNNRSVDSEPQIVVAPPGTAFAGRVYFQHIDETVNENSDTDVQVFYSDDNGANWTGPIRVNDDPASPIRSQFLNQIAVDPTTGALVASWHDARNDNGTLPNGTNAVQNDDAQFWGALSTDGGVTWTNFLIDSGWSNAAAANNGIDFGDWTGSDFQNGKFFAVWASNAANINSVNPDEPRFDLATAKVDVVGAGLPGVYGNEFDDANGNGTRDGGEVGAAGITIYLDVDNSGTLTGGDITTTTGSGGSYAFNGIAAGNYTIRAVTPAGTRPTFPAGGSYVISYDGVNSITGKDFGFVNPRIAGTVFNDANDNGALDAGEVGLSGITVYLDNDNSGTFNAGDTSTASAADGSYTLGGLANGAYTVRIVVPAGRRLTFPAGGFYTATVTNAALVFSGDNFGLTDRVRIAGVVFRDDNGDGTKQGSEPAQSGVRVYQDLNNNGVFDNTGGTFNSTNVPLPVPPTGTTGITTSTLTVSGVGNVTNLTVKIGNVTHPFDGDLIFTIISPLGTRVLLSNRRGGTGDNYINTVFDDTAATSITTGVAPFTGTFKPEALLSTLNGQNANGIWKLEINDAASSDAGTLNAWSITLGSTEPNTITDANGNYAFNGLSAGAYVIREVVPAGFVAISPAGGAYNLNAVGGDLLTGNFSNFPTSFTGSDLTLGMDPTNTNIRIWVNTSSAGAPTFTAAKSALNAAALSFTGTAGDDTFTVDAQFGNPIPTTGSVTFAGGANGAGGDTLRVLGSTGSETVVFNSGTATLGGLTITASGIENVSFDGRLGNDSVTVNGGPTVVFPASQRLSTLNIVPGASASMAANGNRLLVVTTSLGVNGSLDLFDNDMVVKSGAANYNGVFGRIKNALGDSTWNGPSGIFSTTARDNPSANTTLGILRQSEYADNNGSPTFDGETLGAGDVLVKYTYFGDVDFNGAIDAGDYNLIDFGFTSHLTGWANGDADYSGSVDASDYNVIDFAFVSQTGVL